MIHILYWLVVEKLLLSVYSVAKSLLHSVKNLVIDILHRKMFHYLNELKECVSVLNVTVQQYSLGSILSGSWSCNLLQVHNISKLRWVMALLIHEYVIHSTFSCFLELEFCIFLFANSKNQKIYSTLKHFSKNAITVRHVFHEM